MSKNIYEAVAIFIGCVIGAGILGMPYVISKSGFLIGVVYIFVIGGVVLLADLLLGEIILRTKGNHQLTGYAEKYLGKTGKWIMLLSMLFGNYGALVAYLVAEGESISAIFNVSSVLMALWFFCIMATLIFFGLKAVGRSELLANALKILIFLVICAMIFLSNQFNVSNLAYVSPSAFYVPYGVVLFSFLGMVAIPEMKEAMNSNRHELRKAIIIGIGIVTVVYLAFSLVIVGVTGKNTTEVATIGLGDMLGQNAIILANVFAVIAMTTAFLAIGLALKEMYQYDFKLSKYTSWGLTVTVPLIAYLFLQGRTDFIGIIGAVGAIAGGLDGVLIVLMHRKALKLGDRKPEYTLNCSWLMSAAIITLFTIGTVFVALKLAGIIKI